MPDTLWIALALGLRHGTDPDHLTAIDGLSRIRPRATNGMLFALGHGTVVTLLAAGVGHTLAGRVEFLGPWLLILIGLVNLWKLVRPDAPATTLVRRPIVAQPFLLGVLLAAGFETASQLSALTLAGRANPWLLGAAFTGGVLLVDGVDGYLAASTVSLAARGDAGARTASRLLGMLVVVFSLGLGSAELFGVEVSPFALLIGLGLFTAVVAIRVWARRSLRLSEQPASV